MGEATEPVPFGQRVEPMAASPTGRPTDNSATEPVPFGQPVDMGEFDGAQTLVAQQGDERKPLDPPMVAGQEDLPLLHGEQIPDAEVQTSTPGSAHAPTSLPAAGAGSVDVGLMLKEIERRVAGIETRIAEIADGRERVERQVAAQTEELRVQRAAIARTQRAVRNMSRPEDALPTEPALRDPQAAPGGAPQE